MTREEERWTIEQLERMPDIERSQAIVCPQVVERMIGGERTRFQVCIHPDGKARVLGKTSSEPIPTQPSFGFHNGGDVPWAWSTIHENLIMRYMDFLFLVDEDEYSIIALGAMSTYFREVFNTYPYFDFFSAEVDCGKSTALKCLVWSSCYGDLMNTPTPAVIYRDIEESKCVLGIDEIDNALSNKETRGLLLSVFNSGYTKGIPAKRVDLNTMKVQRFDAFGLKAFSRVEDLGPQARGLLSRSITINMIRNPAQHRLEELTSPDVFQPYRDQMYRARLERYEDVAAAYHYVLENSGLQDRIRQIFAPLLSIAFLVGEECYHRTLRFAKSYAQDRQNRSDDPMMRALVEVLLDPVYLGHEVPTVNIRDDLNTRLHSYGVISEDYGLRSRRVNSMLDALGLKRSPKRSQNYVHYFINRDRVIAWATRVYNMTIPTSLQENLSNLSNLENATEGPETTGEGKSEVSEVSEIKGDLVTDDKKPEEAPRTFSAFLEWIREILTEAPESRISLEEIRTRWNGGNQRLSAWWTQAIEKQFLQEVEVRDGVQVCRWNAKTSGEGVVS